MKHPVHYPFKTRLLRGGFATALLFASTALQAQYYNITTPQVWTSLVVADEIDIQPGGSLTIDGGTLIMKEVPGIIRVHSYPLGTVNSQNGGRLIVKNGGKITGDPFANTTWVGVSVIAREVPNAPLLSQQDTRMASAVFTNATIERMRTGICNFDVQGDYQANYSGGGIIQASGCTFQDNVMTGLLQHYQNFSPYNTSLKINDRSFFRTSTFSLNNQYGFLHQGFLRLHDVAGISILGNKFSVSPALTGKNYGIFFTGIRLENAGATIDEFCTGTLANNCQQTVACEFNTMNTGIKAVNVLNNARPVNIRHTTFNDCRSNIDLSGCAGAQLQENVFNINPDYSSQHTAVFLGGSTGYRVEANTINGGGTAPSSQVWGVAVKNSGGDANKVYRNTVSNAEYALQGIDYNRNTGYPLQGLQFLCNTLSNAVPAAYDIVVRESTDPSRFFNGIAGFQGNTLSSAYAEASNSFSALTTTTPHNFRNDGPALTYVGTIPTGGYSSSVSLVPGAAYSCPATYGGPYTISAAAFSVHKSQLEAGIANGGSDADVLLLEYAALHDAMAAYYTGANPDTTTDIDSLLWVLDGAQFLSGYKIRAAGVLAGERQWGAAQTVLAAIPGAYALSKEEEQDINTLSALYGIGKDYEATGWTWSKLSQVAQGTVVDAATKGTGMSRFVARYFLSAGNTGYDFNPEVVRVEDTGVAVPATGGSARTHASGPARLFPNPTTDGLVQVTGLAEGDTYTVADATGRVLRTGSFAGTTGALDLKVLPAGIYLVQVRSTSGAQQMFKVARQ